jgi:hypothetical protein
MGKDLNRCGIAAGCLRGGPSMALIMRSRSGHRMSLSIRASLVRSSIVGVTAHLQGRHQPE